MRISVYSFVVIMSLQMLASVSLAMVTELSLSHSYKKTFINEENFTESQSTTSSVAFHIWAKSAIEFSYTRAVSIREELISQSEPTRKIRQTAEVLGLDFVFGFADRKATLQPYMKGGIAHIEKKLRITQGSLIDTSINPEAEVVPSVGIGAKVLLTDAFALKISYDTWGSQLIGEGDHLDTALNAGITWYF